MYLYKLSTTGMANLVTVKTVLVPVGLDPVANGKMFVLAIERRSSWS